MVSARSTWLRNKIRYAREKVTVHFLIPLVVVVSHCCLQDSFVPMKGYPQKSRILKGFEAPDRILQIFDLGHYDVVMNSYGVEVLKGADSIIL